MLKNWQNKLDRATRRLWSEADLFGNITKRKRKRKLANLSSGEKWDDFETLRQRTAGVVMCRRQVIDSKKFMKKTDISNRIRLRAAATIPEYNHKAHELANEAFEIINNLETWTTGDDKNIPRKRYYKSQD